MKAEWKIPFKKLTWRDNVTGIGKEKGLVYLVGEFYISEKHRNPLISFRVSNSYSGSKIMDKIIVSCDYDFFPRHNEEIEFDSLDLAKEYCQNYLESFIIKTFFEEYGRAV
jgi:hypothetical protein